MLRYCFGRFHLEHLAHAVDQLLRVKRLVHEVVGPCETQVLNLVVLDHAADAQDADFFHGVVRTHPLAHFLAVDVRQHDVENQEVRTIFLHQHAGVEAGGGDLDLEAAVLFEELRHDFDELSVVVNEKDLAAARFERIGRDAVVLHELVQHFARDAAKARPRDSEALELPVVKATDNGLLADLANLGSFACRENGLHGYVHPLPAPSRPLRQARDSSLPSRRRRTQILMALPLPYSVGLSAIAHRIPKMPKTNQSRKSASSTLLDGFTDLADGPDYN